jgi:hypothetical protein
VCVCDIHMWYLYVEMKNAQVNGGQEPGGR